MERSSGGASTQARAKPSKPWGCRSRRGGCGSDLATFAPHGRSSEWGPETQGTRPIGVFGKPVPDNGYPGVLTGSQHCSAGGFGVACRWGSASHRLTAPGRCARGLPTTPAPRRVDAARSVRPGTFPRTDSVSQQTHSRGQEPRYEPRSSDRPCARSLVLRCPLRAVDIPIRGRAVPTRGTETAQFALCAVARHGATPPARAGRTGPRTTPPTTDVGPRSAPSACATGCLPRLWPRRRRGSGPAVGVWS
jgi:hypothetical protein